MIYRDIYDGPPRSYIRERTGKQWIVIHSTQNDASAEGEASYAKRRTDGISSHYYIDGNSIVQSLDTDLGAHHVGSSTGNRGGISYELTGFAAWSRSRWLERIAWRLLVAAVARDCAEHNIIPRDLSVAQIKNGATGIITHNQARLAWGHTTHTDPGPNFPMDHLVRQVRRELEEEDMTKEEVEEAVITALNRRRKLPDDRQRSIAWLIEWGYVHAAGARRLLKAQQPLLEAAAQGQPMTAEQVATVAAEVAAVVEAGLADEVADELGKRLGDDDT